MIKRNFKIFTVFGTRPEAIKMTPVIKMLEKTSGLDPIVCLTGQHREMLDQVINSFDINVNFDLKIMKKNQNLAEITSKIISELYSLFAIEKPDLVLVHGDTTTAFAGALAAFYHKIPVGHVEAGLRTGIIKSPWPEEANRKFISCISELNFAPTNTSKTNLIKENVAAQSIEITGNTVIDSLLMVKSKILQDKELNAKLAANFPFLSQERKVILVTAHRRENIGQGLKNICDALADIADLYDDSVNVVIPVHPNPAVKDIIYSLLKNKNNIYLIDPLEYIPFVYLMLNSYLIITDSGGIQEEAPTFGKPVLVIRDTTERPEAVDAGTVKLIGTDYLTVKEGIINLLSNKTIYQNMANANNPYGDGLASKKIVDKIISYLSSQNN